METKYRRSVLIILCQERYVPYCFCEQKSTVERNSKRYLFTGGWDPTHLVDLLLLVVEQAREVLQRTLVEDGLGLIIRPRDYVAHGSQRCGLHLHLPAHRERKISVEPLVSDSQGPFFLGQKDGSGNLYRTGTSVQLQNEE